MNPPAVVDFFGAHRKRQAAASYEWALRMEAKMITGFRGFPPETLKFLRQLKRNNNRPWFQERKEIYETKVRQPMIDLVIALGGPMQAFAPEMNVDPKKAIYRIYRDTRFSNDKTPYKTQVSAFFVPRGMSKSSAAGLYLQVDPDEVLIAGGVYMPGAAELRAIRAHIAAHYLDLRSILNGRDLKKKFGGLQGDKLSRAPLGYPPDHPAIEYLRYKHVIVWRTEPASIAETPRLFPSVLRSFAAMMPLVRFINTAIPTR
jgi:uncharacterized protein (TIGR02453 family)